MHATADTSMPSSGDAAPDTGLYALCAIAGYYRIGAEPDFVARELSLFAAKSDRDALLRGAALLGLKARAIDKVTVERLRKLPAPAIAQKPDGDFVIYTGCSTEDVLRFVDPVSKTAFTCPATDAFAHVTTSMLLLTRRFAGAGSDPDSFGRAWLWASIKRYRRPLGNVLLASLVVQLFALASPLFFQVVIDKVLVNNSRSTLWVLVVGLVIMNLFDAALQYLRSYALNHTTARIDAELGARLYSHLLRLPMSYFEKRAAGQIAAAVRELENIRNFITGQGLFALLDVLFAVVFIGVLFLYSSTLALVVCLTVPLYAAVAFLIRPVLKLKLDAKYDCGAIMHRSLIETLIGMQTVKASAAEPVLRSEWEEKTAAYVRTEFSAGQTQALGQTVIQGVNKLSTALLLLLGATAVMNGDLTVGALVAFNMIAGQAAQPVLRLSQLWQDLQQVQISLARIGDILQSAPEPVQRQSASLPAPRGEIAFENVSFRYHPEAPEVLHEITLKIMPGESIGIVGASGSGKSSLTKLLQRLYLPTAGRITLDGIDLTQLDPARLRRYIGVVLQENQLFHRSVHDNIALSDPAMSRERVIHAARLAGADAFISAMPGGYDALIEERGGNLSGGQRQRLAIARALAGNPPLLIFDEATGALDYESERIVQNNMNRMAHGRTVITVAHRLSAVRHCTRIVGMDQGRIVEVGTHEELLAQRGLYARLYALQNERDAA